MSIKDQLHVLVVDDMATSRGLITQSLAELGIRNVAWEEDGKVAFDRLQRQPVHLIISDQNMPNMTGLDLLQSVRTHPQLGRTGFILVTGSPEPGLLKKGTALGLNNYIRKPFTTPDMKRCIEHVVGKL
ncbi:MAG: response regulator [Litorimonas sp.]